MSLVASIVVAVVAFVAMEGVSYASHRWLMHGAGIRWHRSHHVPPKGGWEPNDIFPLLFSVIGFAIFAIAALADVTWMYWAGGGVTAYGAVYLFVHEVYIHRRVPWPMSDVRYFDWLRESHRIHHVFGGEPYGMLLPLVSRQLRERAAQRSSDDRQEPTDDRPARRERIPSTRSRL